MEQTTPCAACSSPVSAEELEQGLAVKVSGRLLCPLCLDHLPGDAKVLVNQMRALRGMAVTTYRYFSGRHPGLPLYTFTTANLLLSHRRKLVHGETFEAPPLPPPGSRPRMPSAAEAGRGERSGWMMVGGLIILVVTGVVWLAIPSAKPPVVPPVQGPVAPLVPDPPKAADPPTRNPANELTELDRRLRAHPEEAQAIADAAELLRDSLAPRDVAMRNRADSLIREATAIADAQRAQPKPEPPPPAPKPEPAPAPIAAPVVPEPVAPAPPKPEPPAPPVVVAEPQPTPADDPVKEPKEPKEPKPEKSEAMDTEVVVFWPKGGKALLEPGGLPRIKELPWPWPTGVPIHAGALDAKLKPRRLAIELRLAGVAAAGGATVVLHPGKAERGQLSASWTDGTNSVGPLNLELTSLRWQAVAIPATGCETLDQNQLRLRLEDVRDLGDQRPFLVAGASTRSAGVPTAADRPPRVPLLLPPALETANGWSTFRASLRKLAGKSVDERQFTFAKAKVLMPFKDQGAKFRTALREELALLQHIDRLPNGNPDDLPSGHADFANPQAGWPNDGMGDISDHPAVAFGWRSSAWGAENDLGRRLDGVLGKMLAADKKTRRSSIVPVLIIGDIDTASAAERSDIDRRWLDHALRLAALGVPVIDLRPAQAEPSTAQVQRVAAAMLADGLRQLDWLLKL